MTTVIRAVLQILRWIKRGFRYQMKSAHYEYYNNIKKTKNKQKHEEYHDKKSKKQKWGEEHIDEHDI